MKDTTTKETKKKTSIEEEVTNDSIVTKRNSEFNGDRTPDYRAHPSVRPPKDRKLVKGIFKNIECPGTMHVFSFRHYKEPIKTYYLQDGAEYELPIEVVEHLNKNCAYKIPKWQSGTEVITGKPAMAPGQPGWEKKIEKVISRFQFQPTNYVEATV